MAWHFLYFVEYVGVSKNVFEKRKANKRKMCNQDCVVQVQDGKEEVETRLKCELRATSTGKKRLPDVWQKPCPPTTRVPQGVG